MTSVYFKLSVPSRTSHSSRNMRSANGERERINLQEIEWSNHAQCLYETHYTVRGALNGDFGNSIITPDL